MNFLDLAYQKAIGGGGSVVDNLNFALKPYATEAAMLADTPKENTVGVVTETDISDYMFSATQPTTRSDGTALSGGEVWIKTGVASSAAFNALRKNVLSVYPVSAYQYSGSAWTAKTAKIYQESTWASLQLTLITNGVVNTAFTGALTAYAYDTATAPTITQGSGYLQTNGNANIAGNLSFANDIDITDVQTLYVDMEALDAGGDNTVKFGTGGTRSDITFTASVSKAGPFARQILSVDVSTITGPQIIKLFQGYKLSCKIYNMWGEY